MMNIGIIGFGEAGSAFAEVLASEGAVVRAYDQAWAKSDSDVDLKVDVGDDNIRSCSLADLLASSDVVLSTVTTDAALDAAGACIADLRPQQYYCDLNSTAPSIKVDLHRLIEPTKALFVEGAILGAIGVTGGKTKILLGGAHAAALSELLNQLGMNTAPYSAEVGKASTFKMLRSIFSKGLEALLIEFLMAGREAGLEDDLWQEITTLFAKNNFDDVARNWVCSHGVAHERRYHEMIQVADLLTKMNHDGIMTNASLAFFKRATDLKLSHGFTRKPEEMNDVVEALMRCTSTRP